METRPKEPPSLSEESEISESEEVGTIIDDAQIVTCVNNTPGALDIILVRGIIDTTTIYDGMLGDILLGLSEVLMKALYSQDGSATDQLRALQKIVYPEKYELPFSKIKQLVSQYETSPHLARGWELRRLMSWVAPVLEPVRSDKPLAPDQPVRLTESPRPQLLDRLETVKKHLKRGSTLQSIAIGIYLEQLSEMGITDGKAVITSVTLKRDLAKVREWDETHSLEEKRRRGYTPGYPLGGDDKLAWCDHSDGWKTRRIKKTHKKNRPKKKG
jgi:hypothetical protein